MEKNALTAKLLKCLMGVSLPFDYFVPVKIISDSIRFVLIGKMERARHFIVRQPARGNGRTRKGMRNIVRAHTLSFICVRSAPHSD